MVSWELGVSPGPPLHLPAGPSSWSLSARSCHCGSHCCGCGVSRLEAGTVARAGVPAAEAAMGLSGHPGSVCAHHKCAHHWAGGCPQEQPSTGQVQIVLKHTDELGSGGAKEFRISAESHFVHFYCSCPIKTQLLRVIVVLGAAVKGSRPQTSPDLPN